MKKSAMAVPKTASLVAFAGALLLASVPLLWTRPAQAEDLTAILMERSQYKQSPQHFAFEFRFGPYTPQVDSDPNLNGSKPYARYFGTSPQFLFGAEFDWQAYKIPYVGPIGIGFGASYSQANGKSISQSSATGGAEPTSLQVVPMQAVLVLRVESIMTESRVPLVPYGKAGFSAAYWRSFTDSGTSDVPDPVTGVPINAQGVTWGTYFGAGIAFQLNVFDPRAAHTVDTIYGINNTYLFWEFTYWGLDGLFGQQNPLILKDATWVGGLAFEF